MNRQTASAKRRRGAGTGEAAHPDATSEQAAVSNDFVAGVSGPSPAMATYRSEKGERKSKRGTLVARERPPSAEKIEGDEMSAQVGAGRRHKESEKDPSPSMQPRKKRKKGVQVTRGHSSSSDIDEKLGGKIPRESDQEVQSVLRSVSPAHDGATSRKDGASVGNLERRLKAQISQLQSDKERLKTQVDALTSTVARQDDAMAQVQSQCTCTICLELAWRPHVLSPCGHMFCARCLMMWFKRPSPNEAPMPPYFSPEQRAAEERRRTVRRVKVCPHCREKVLAPPAEVWAMKSMIEMVEQNSLREHGDRVEPMTASLSAAPPDAVHAQRGEDLPAGTALWRDMFDQRQARQPIWDVDDQVYRCGACSSEVVEHQCTNERCLMMYLPDDFGDEDFDLDAAGWDSDEEREYEQAILGHHPHWELQSGSDEDWDEEDEDFIDDGPVGSTPSGDSSDDDDDDDDGDDDGDDIHIVQPVNEIMAREATADESDVQEVDQAGQPIQRRRRRVVATLSDSDDEHDDARVNVAVRRQASPLQRHFSDEDEDSSDAHHTPSTPSIYVGSDDEEMDRGELADSDEETASQEGSLMSEGEYSGYSDGLTE